MNHQEKKAPGGKTASGSRSLRRKKVGAASLADPEGAAQVLHVQNMFGQRLEACSSRSDASRKLGKAPTYLKDQTRYGRSHRYGDMYWSLRAAGYPVPGEFFFLTHEPVVGNPLGALAMVREFQCLKPDPLLQEMRPRLEALVHAPADAAADWDCGAEEIWSLDLLRRRNRPGAVSRLTELLKGAMARLDALAVKPLRGIAEVCLMLYVFAACYRLAGRRDDASDWFELAWPLVQKARGHLLRGDWFLRASYLLVDLNYPARALWFAKEALVCFAIADDHAKCQRALVQMAYVLTHAGKHEESRQMLVEVLPRLPANDREARIAAHQLLAGNLQAAGNLLEAQIQLEAAIALMDQDALAHATCLWRLGKLLVALGDVPGALEKHAAALPLFSRLFGAGELAELGMEYAALLRKEGRRPELKKLAADLCGWIDQLKGNPKLRNVITDFQALVRLDKLNDETFEGLLGELKAAQKALRVVRLRPRAGARKA